MALYLTLQLTKIVLFRGDNFKPEQLKFNTMKTEQLKKEEEIKEVWVNVYRNTYGTMHYPFTTGNTLFNSREEAEKYQSGSNYIGAFPLTFTLNK